MAKNQTTVMLHPVVASYPHVFDATSFRPDEPKKFTCNFLINKKTQKDLIAEIEDAVEAAIEKGKESKYGGKAPRFDDVITEVLRDGDDDRDANFEKPGYAGHYYVVAKSDEDRPPAVVDKNGKELIQKGLIYPGVIVAADINFYPFSGRAKGVAVGLNTVFRLKDGERLGGGRSAKEALKTVDFSSYVDDEEDVDDAPRSRRSSRGDDDRDRPVSRRSARNVDADGRDNDREESRSRRSSDRDDRDDDRDNAPRSRRSSSRRDDVDGD